MSESPAKSNTGEYSVSEISGALKRTVEDRFGHVRVRGEISGYRGPHSSGHCYFSLKDDRARLEAVIWRGVASKLKHLPEEGLEVIATGKLTTYPGSSKYQIVIEGLEPAGAGALMALLEERKKKLTAEGLFAPERKQILPYLPKTIGVITSPTGAVIRDVLHRLSDRFPLHVLVWPVRVQGDSSGDEVANAIRGFNALSETSGIPTPDLIIVARGGGSVEDLWGFNDEAVVRATADSDLPIISAVGHETDWTLIDLAADVRAPTPTGAAEIAVPVKADLEANIANLAARLQSGISRKLERHKSELRAAERGLATPDTLLAMPRRRLDEASGRLGRGLGNLTQRHRSRLDIVAKRLNVSGLEKTISRADEALGALLQRKHIAIRNQLERIRGRLNQASRLIETLSYNNVLARGYALVLDADQNAIMSANAIVPGDAFTVRMKDGEISGLAQSGKGVKRKASAPKKTKAPTAIKTDQGDLF